MNIIRLFLPFCLFFFTAVWAAGMPKTLVVMLDGVRADATNIASTPHIDSLRNGSWAEGYHGAWSFAAHTIRDAAPNSAPNHTAIATGVSATKSHVKGNDYFEDYSKSNASAAYNNFLSRIEKRFPEKSTVFLYSWGPDAVLVDKNNRCDFARRDGDAKNARKAAAMLEGSHEEDGWKKGTDVDVMLVYNDEPDHAGHAGGFSPPGKKHDGYIKSIELADAWIGAMLDSIKKRPGFANEDWLIIVCADHGGWIGGHGDERAETYTVPLIMSGKKVVSGPMRGEPCVVDIAPTVLDHFGLDVAAMREFELLDGTIRGKSEPAITAIRPIEEGLLVYLPFDGTVENKAEAASIPPENRGGNFETTGGKKAGFLALRGADTPQFVSLGNPESLKRGVDGGLTVACWVRMNAPQKGDPVLFGNKNWKDGNNSGITLFVAPQKTDGNNLALNLADASGRRVDVKQFFFAPAEWWFCAASIDRTGNATVYAGSPNGRLYFGSMSLIGETVPASKPVSGTIDSPLPWNIGQDGTGTYGSRLDADLDEFRLWNRALTLEEIEAVYKTP